MSSIYESQVDPLRPNDAHGISLQLTGGNKRVLELGAASGHVTKALVELGNKVTAVERDGRFVPQLSKLADEVHITDLDWLDLRELLNGTKFDVILAGDVLEHCSRPDLVLHQCHDLLAQGGSVVVSLPNVAHGDVRLALLTGRFEYRSVGLLDSTHLRFFTRDSIIDFADSCGFEVAEIYASTTPIGTTEFGAPDASIPREAIEFVQSDRDHTVYQYISRFVPRPGFPSVVIPPSPERSVEKLLAELAQSQEALAALRAAGFAARSRDVVNDFESRLTQAQQDLAAMSTRCADYEADIAQFVTRIGEQAATIDEQAATNQALKIKFLGARDYAIGSAAELGEMRYRFEASRREIDSLVHQLNLLHSSRTWRIGRFVLLPLRGFRWLLRKLMA